VATDEPLLAGVAGRYASALYELAAEEGKVAEVERDLATFEALYGMSADLARMVRSPVIPAEEQGRALDVLLARVGVGGLARNFFKVIARNRRLFAAPDMARAFRALAAKARGEVTAEVASAVALSGSQVAALREALKASVGKEVVVSAKVDPSLLGGLVVKLGSRMLDSSLKTKLATLRVSLKGGL